MNEPNPCRKCGKPGKHMYRKPYHWIQCMNAECNFKTPLACDYFEENDPESIAVVWDYWNHGVER